MDIESGETEWKNGVSEIFQEERKTEGGKDSMWRIKWNNPNKMPITPSAQKKLIPCLSSLPFLALLIEIKVFYTCTIDWFHSLCPGFYICYLLIFIRMLPNCYITSIYPKRRLKFREEKNCYEITWLGFKSNTFNPKEIFFLYFSPAIFFLLITISNDKVSSSSNAHGLRTFIYSNAKLFNGKRKME